MSEQITAYVTKWALTDSILQVTGEIARDGLLSYKAGPKALTDYAFGEGKDWHRTEAEALARVEVLRKAKIISLNKSISKLEKFKPKIVDVRYVA